MKAALSVEVGAPMVIEEVALRPPGRGEVVVTLDASAMCTTDVRGLDGMSRARRPYITGHSATGIVTESGPDVTRCTVGDRVVVAGTVECGACYACLRGTPSQCDVLWAGAGQPHVVAYRRDGSEVTAEGGVGTFAEQMVYRESVLAVVDSDLPVEQLALLGCGGISGVGAVLEVGRVQPGDTVAIVGCGHLGLWMMQAAQLAGASRIIAVEHDPSRLAIAGRLGATDLVTPQENPVEQVLDLTGGRGVDVGLEASGSTRVMEDLFFMTRRGGVLVLTSMESREATVTLPGIPLAIHGRQLRSSQSGGGHLRRDVPRIAHMVEARQLSADHFVSAVLPLDEINKAADLARDRQVINAVIAYRNL